MQRVLITVLLFLIPCVAIAQDRSSTPDGRMWANYSNSGSESLFGKAAYVQGVIEGLRAGATIGYVNGRLDEKNAALNHLKPCLKGPWANIPIASLIDSNTTNGFDTGAAKVLRTLTAQNASVLDVVRQMDKFYTNYRNTPVCMIVAVQESIASLRGEASSEQALQIDRKGEGRNP